MQERDGLPVGLPVGLPAVLVQAQRRTGQIPEIIRKSQFASRLADTTAFVAMTTDADKPNGHETARTDGETKRTNEAKKRITDTDNPDGHETERTDGETRRTNETDKRITDTDKPNGQTKRTNIKKMISDMIKNALAAGCGSFIGGAGRYLISTAMRNVSTGFPWGTLAVNLAGCLMIGLLWGFFSRTSDENGLWPVFLTTGLCGGFTTFSTFSKEALAMLQVSNYSGFASYIGISIIAGIGAAALGYVLMK